MKVIICGAGQVGWQIARQLSGERNDVTLVGVNADLVRRATDTLDVQGVVGFASYPDVLEKAGARDAAPAMPRNVASPDPQMPDIPHPPESCA